MPGKGLEDVIAAQTSISDIDGKMGRLFYVGYDIHDLAPNATFEEIIHLLHNLKLPDTAELDDLNEQLVAEREISPFIEDLMPTMASQTSPMSMLRTLVSAMSAYDPDGWDQSERANYRKALRLIPRFPTGRPAHHRLRKELDPTRPTP